MTTDMQMRWSACRTAAAWRKWLKPVATPHTNSNPMLTYIAVAPNGGCLQRKQNGSNSPDKLHHTRSVAYSVELVVLNKHQISGGGAYLDCYQNGNCNVIFRRHNCWCGEFFSHIKLLVCRRFGVTVLTCHRYGLSLFWPYPYEHTTVAAICHCKQPWFLFGTTSVTYVWATCTDSTQH